MSQQAALTREQKEAIGLLSIGTFLEYFDLMLYVHMAVLLNDLFFSKTDSFSASLLSAFSFCASFIFRPIGALLIGWLGDTHGRKSTIILTTSVMAISCVTMTLLPTYDKIGILASITVTLCRIFQGMSSMGERVGAEIYLTELIKPPKVYPAVASIVLFGGGLGSVISLLVANLTLSQTFNWRIAFLIGAMVAFVGTIARTTLRETNDFADAKRELHKLCDNLKIDKRKLKGSLVYTEKINIKFALSYFLIQLGTPIYFYFSYVYCAGILKNSFNYSIEQVIFHNLILSLVELSMFAIVTYLVSFIHPLKILRIKFYIAAPFFLICPFLLNNVTNSFELMLIQSFIVIFSPTEFSIAPILYKSFPIFKRFTSVCFIHAISRALMYTISAFGIVYLIRYFSNLGLLFLFVPVNIGFLFALLHFEKLEKKAEIYKEELIDSDRIENNA